MKKHLLPVFPFLQINMDAPPSFAFCKGSGHAIDHAFDRGDRCVGHLFQGHQPSVTAFDRRWLRRAWKIFLVSIAFGIWALMGLAGSIAQPNPAADAIFEPNVAIPGDVPNPQHFLRPRPLDRHASNNK